jgi:hypothetical protein
MQERRNPQLLISVLAEPQARVLASLYTAGSVTRSADPEFLLRVLTG